MNILLINHYAGSPEMGMEYRPYYLAKEWISMGHKVMIVAASFSHVRTNQPDVKTNFQNKNIDGIDYFWIKTPEYKGNSAKRFFNMLIFVDKLSHKANLIAKTFIPDVVIASSTYPLDIFPANRIAKKSKAKLVFEIHDLWPLSPMELGGYSKFHPFIMLMQYAENYAYKKCDSVISILPKTLEHTVNHGLDSTKWNCVPNGIILDEWRNIEKIDSEIYNQILEQKKLGKKLIAYTGTVGLANALDTFIDTAKILINQNITFFIVGKGPEKERFLKRKTDEKIENLFFINPVPKQQVPDLLSKFDFLYIGLQSQSLFRFGISPNKIFDYMMAEKPIIQAIDAGNNIIEEAECGITVKPENAEETAAAILKLSEFQESKLECMGKNGKEFVLKNHEFSILAEKFIKILEKNSKIEDLN